MKKLSIIGLMCLLFETGSVFAEAAPSISRILKNLKIGNQRFISGDLERYDYQEQIRASKDKQTPESVVLSCMDSRGIPELAFNQGIGHMFTVRIAGNVVNDDILGSIEFATKVVGSKVIVVMGHTGCGAVKGACEKVDIGHIGAMVSKIDPAVEEARANNPQGKCSDPAFIDEIARLNVIHMIQDIKRRSLIIAGQIKAQQIKIIGAMYDIRTGKVDFAINQ